MEDYLRQQKERISTYLDNYLKQRKVLLKGFEILDENIFPILIDFSKRGKMIRGGLVQLGYSLYREEETENTFIAGACLELLQSALLIHDDIMDRDKVRRGEPSVFYEYRNRLFEKGVPDAYHAGESMGICAGDIAFAVGADMLSELNCPYEVHKKIGGLCAREMMFVGMAQMQDVLFGATPEQVTIQRIFELYRLKTGRYSFSLPLMLGAQLAEAGPDAMDELSDLGENMGILFQMKDDELGLFASEEALGKPVGGDIREGKKTLFAHLLYEHATEEEQQRLEGIFGNPEADEKDITYVQTLMKRHTIPDKVNDHLREIARNVEARFNAMKGVREAPLHILRQLHDYNVNRSY